MCLLVATVLLCCAGCGAEKTPYQINDSQGYTVSVVFDANGGTFTTNAPVIADSYNVSAMPVNGEGMVEIPLLAPEDARREKDAFKATRNGYFLAGWYAECQKNEATGEYTYGKPWNFETDRLQVDPAGDYASAEPVLTLYAAWVPMYQIEFYDLQSGELMSRLTFDPSDGTEFTVPAWDTESGAVDMYKFPKKEGYTFRGAYYDAAGTQPVESETIVHNGTVDAATATSNNATMQLYLDFEAGEWYRISTAEQFADNFTPNGCYEILADLDFTEATWPTNAVYGSFTGTIRGNGHTISNVTVIQTDNNKVNAGLFGQLTDTAVLQDMTFDNISFTIKKGARMAGTAYGLFCGTAAQNVTLRGVVVTNSTLLIDSGCYFGTEDYVIGLACGMGENVLDPSGITCIAVGDAPESVVITVTDSQVSVEFVTE